MDCGADELGFNFYSGSPRCVSPDDARSIIDALPITSENVGVFVNEPIERVIEISSFVGLDGIQLHGDESGDYVEEILERTMLFVIKAFRVSPTFSVIDALAWNTHYYLFDTYSPNVHGGTGQRFDWEGLGPDIILWVPNLAYLAGGLTAENVGAAIGVVKPYAVDVASGVESAPGRKDPKKVEAFIKAAKDAL
jgi:phosphoribosylanthranilate isomerase